MPSGSGSKVLLDTNSLIYSLKQRVNLRDILLQIPEVSGISIPRCVIQELEKMADSVNYARGALELAKTFQTVEGTGPADDCILEIASREGYIILTNDRELAGRAKKSGIRILSFRQSKRIDFV